MPLHNIQYHKTKHNTCGDAEEHRGGCAAAKPGGFPRQLSVVSSHGEWTSGEFTNSTHMLLPILLYSAVQ